MTPVIVFRLPAKVVVVPALKVQGFVREIDPVELFVRVPPFSTNMDPGLLPKLLEPRYCKVHPVLRVSPPEKVLFPERVTGAAITTAPMASNEVLLSTIFPP